MFVKAQSHQYRYQGAVTGIRQRAVSNSEREKMSAALKRAVIIALCAAFMLVFGASQLFYWKIMESHKAMVDLQTTVGVSSELNADLLTEREQLLMPQRIKAIAAVKFDLHVPLDSQIHRF